MILADTSAWVDFLRDAPTPAADFVDEHLGALAVTEPVMLEVLAGLPTGPRTSQVERLLVSQPWCHLDPIIDYRAAVDIYQHTRSTGHQVRSLTDCLIAAIALREGATVAHRDADFERIADATGLQTVDLRN